MVFGEFFVLFEARFGILSQKERGWCLLFWVLRFGLAGEEGGAAACGRKPPASLARGLIGGGRETCRAFRSSEVRREK